MKLLAALVLLLAPLALKAAPLEECGVYAMEGLISKKESTWVLVLEEGSFSEVRVYLKGKGSVLDQLRPGIFMRAKVLVKSNCLYDCEGVLVGAAEALKPNERPRPFLYPRPKPITKMQCE